MGASTEGSESGADASVGLVAKVDIESNSGAESTTTAVTTKYKSGGNINSTSTERTTLIGTQFESEGDINIEAGSLDFKAANDTSTSSSSNQEIGAEAKIGKSGGSLDASFADADESGKTSTARTGSIAAGGNLNIKTKGDASFEGTQIEAGDQASISAGGSVEFNASRDTTEASNNAIEASVGLSIGKDMAGEASGGFSKGDSSSDKAQTASIKAGSGGINIEAGKDVSFEGTQISSDGQASISAGGSVNFDASQDTTEASDTSIEGSVGFGDETEASAGFSNDDSSSDKAQTTNITVGSGGINIEAGKDVNFEGTQVNSDGDVTVGAGGSVNQKAAESSEKSLSISAEISTEDGPDGGLDIDGEVSSELTSIQSGGKVTFEPLTAEQKSRLGNNAGTARGR